MVTADIIDVTETTTPTATGALERELRYTFVLEPVSGSFTVDVPSDDATRSRVENAVTERARAVLGQPDADITVSFPGEDGGATDANE